jgi:class 3 adenylate cyclase/tetratricopeptide (TPR) repeat protein
MLESTHPSAPETRKTVTILFIDAVSSTALGEQMDPESLRAVMTRYFDVMREAIVSHGGIIEKFIGDAVLAIFGVPAVHEDDALRACRAALEIHHRLTELEPLIRADLRVAIEWRMGINTGPVVAGDMASGQRIVTGDAVNVAARLEATAAPGEVLIGAATYAMVRDAVSAEPLAALSLKGKSEPVPAWRLVALREGSRRRSRLQEAPIVGRRRPLELLENAFRQAVEERVCHLFTVLGVAGVGKTRLVDEFVAGVGHEAAIATGRCLAYGSGITYWPVAEALRSGIANAEPAANARQAALAAILADEVEAERLTGAVGSLLGMNADAHDQEELFWAVRKTFEALARRRPLVLVLDDIHWGEPTFLDLVEHIAERTRDAPILLIAVARLELFEIRPLWGGGKRSSTTVELGPLSEVESGELLSNLLGMAELPIDFQHRVSRVAEGNPLFLEELLANLIDDGALRRTDDGWAAAGDLHDLAMPPTIQAVLAARLDRLGAEERMVIERAAVEGHTFHRGAVTALVPETLRDQVPEQLASLVRMELVRPEPAAFAGEEAYRFRHVLIRDAAYQGLAKQTRSALHERLAAWLERVAGDRLLEYEEIIAYHLEQAYRYRIELGPRDAAADLALRAGTMLGHASRRAEARGDVAASVDLMARAAKLLPPSADRRLLLAQVAPNLLFAGDGPRAETLLKEVVAESEEAGDARGGAWANLGLLFVQSSTQSSEASAYARDAERLRDRLTELGDLEGAQQAELLAALGQFVIGRAGAGLARAQAILDAVPSSIAGSLANRARGLRAVAAMLGPTPADEALRLVEAEGRHATQLPGVASGPARMLCLQGRFAEARAALSRATEQAAERGGRLLSSETHEVAGNMALLTGEIDEAVRNLKLAYDEKMAAGDPAGASTTATALAEAYLEAGDLDAAWTQAANARESSPRDDLAAQGRSREIQARVLSARGQHGEAEALAREAVTILGRTDYLALHGDALVHLGHVLHAAGREDEAVAAARQAVELYERKQARFLVERTRKVIGAWGGRSD